MKILKALFGNDPDPRERFVPLYSSIVAEARQPLWYAEMGVPDTLDGRFDMVAAILALVLMRTEEEGEGGRQPGVLLTEIFIEDMDGQLREIGVGDVVVGKHVGNMMAAMGGRLQAYRDAIDDEGALAEALQRNLWRGKATPDARPSMVAARLRSIAAALRGMTLDSLIAQGIPG